ncbi:MAG TPA: MFS transporter [Pirellulaceae bacterium]|nr:MFS transporter [Pirellulaceae bacterium]
MWNLHGAKRVICLAGCLAMAYLQLTTSPATIEFARAHGGSGLHIGILGALPTLMLFMQFLAGMLVNHLKYRRALWMGVSLLQRLAFVPLAIGAWLWPDLPGETWVWGLILATAVNQSLTHFGNPLWMSWMGDYLPHKGLSEFWGNRHLWQQWTAAGTLAVSALVIFRCGLDPMTSFSALIVVGAVLGISDVLLFSHIEEPPVKAAQNPQIWKVLKAPFQNPSYFSFIKFTCFWHFAAMIGSPFISMYMLEEVGLSLFGVLQLWSAAWAGGAIFSRGMGRLAERFGQRPVLVLCTAFKPLNMLSLLICPSDPTLAFWFLVPMFMVDAVLNAGINIGSNGFMLKQSPSENRAMFVAAGTALAGTIGGITAIASGFALKQLSGWSWELGGYTVVGFHVLFGLSLAFRCLAVHLARALDEPTATRTRDVLRILLLEPALAWGKISPEEAASDVEPAPVLLSIASAPSDSEIVRLDAITRDRLREAQHQRAA